MKVYRSRKKIFCSKLEKSKDFMKGLSMLNKIVLSGNIIVALLLFLASLTPYVSVHTFPALSFLGLAVPVLVALNILFFLYWLVGGKRHWVLSFLALLLGYLALGNFVHLPFGSNTTFSKDELTIMSYNVREFNKNEVIDRNTIYADIKEFINNEDPDIVCFQEVGRVMKKDFPSYPYRQIGYIRNSDKVHLGILSKYPIVDGKSLNFPKTSNNGSFADIAYKNDTIRIYNLHLQSLGITPGGGVIRKSSSKKLYKQLTGYFKQQEVQANFVIEHATNVDYKKIFCGDFNNSQFSRAYKILAKDKVDTFKAKGSGYGRTFSFHGVPVRIDFILADPQLEVTAHKNYNVEYSDHFPIMASFRLEGK